MSDSLTDSTPANLASHICIVCNACFDSRNKLFKHVKKCATQNQVAQQKSCSQQLSTKPANVETYLYAVGGRQRGRTLRSVERYSFETQKWELCAQMMENRGSHGAGSINGVLYAVGGGGFRSNLSSCEAYDGKEWHPSPPLCVSRHALAVTNANNDTIYAVGGWIDGKECSAVVERFRLGTDGGAGEWVTVAPLNQARKLHAVTAFPASSNRGVQDGKQTDDFLYTFGGNCDDQHWHTNTAEVYDPVADTWKFIAPMPAAGGASAAVVLPFVFVFLHGRYVLRYDPVTDSYVRLSDLPLLDWHCFEVVAVPNSTHIVALGGVSNGRWCNSMFQYDAATDTWSQLPSMRTARRRCASAIVTVEKPSADVADSNEAKKQKVDTSL